MAGGGFAVDESTMDFDGKITLSVVITCMVAASCGLIYGYDVGVTGGVTTMVPFLQKFFPSILQKAASAEVNIYCVYDSQVLTLFTSSLYLAGLVSSLVASRFASTFGRRNTMVLGGALFLSGSAVNGGAQNIAMLILGRILLGLGVGFTTQVGPLYVSEIAPPKNRGALSGSFAISIGVGSLVASCINYGVAKKTWGWRLSLGLAAVPASVTTIGAYFISDTPSSLVERGKIEQARIALQKIRGSSVNVEPELEQLIILSQIAKSMEQNPFRTILERQYRPNLLIAVAIALSQQLTGINVVAFYAPNLFQSVGLGRKASLLSAVVLAAVNIVSNILAAYFVDRMGRRLLFKIGGIIMLLCQIGVSIVLAVETGVHGTKDLTKGYAILVLVLLCSFSAGFGISWGPLSWLVGSEIFPLKIRTTGQSISVAVQFITVFVLSQTFLSMFCHFKFGTFLFYAAWVIVMTLFVIYFLPETKGIHIESMDTVWGKHWFWQRFVKGQVDQDNHP